MNGSVRPRDVGSLKADAVNMFSSYSPLPHSFTHAPSSKKALQCEAMLYFFIHALSSRRHNKDTGIQEGGRGVEREVQVTSQCDRLILQQ